jgi:DNA-binding NarL/FixJ family response regulator
MSSILVIEDNPYELEELVRKLKKEGYKNIMSAIGTDDANDLLKKKEFEYIIFDLNMSNEFIPDDLMEDTEGGMFTGWVWYYHVVYKETKPFTKILISSAFVSNLYEKIISLDVKDDERLFFESSLVKKVSKQDGVNNVDKIIEELKMF